MIYNKTVKNNPNCNIVLSHAEGTLPYLLSRPTSIFCKTEAEIEEFWGQARDFYYDVAVAGHENVLTILEKFAEPGHILYGSDAPYAHAGIIDFHTSRLDEYKFADPKLRDAINRGNALALFPRLKD
jgi:6-methylsalicylate decarboxylase